MNSFTGAALPPPSLRNPADDPDGDGLNNATEYALNLEPMVQNPTAHPQVGLTSGTARYLGVVYRLNRFASDLAVSVERAPRLEGPWTTNGIVPFVRVRINANTDMVAVRSVTRVESQPTEFLRVNVKLAP